MLVVEFVFGIILGLVAVGFVAWSAEEGTVRSLGGAVLLCAAAGFLLFTGVHTLNARAHAKHMAILRDVTRQGFSVPSDRVYADTGGDIYGSSVSFVAGRCRFPFIARKIAGTWRLALLGGDGKAIVVVRPADVARITATCPGR